MYDGLLLWVISGDRKSMGNIIFNVSYILVIYKGFVGYEKKRVSYRSKKKKIPPTQSEATAVAVVAISWVSSHLGRDGRDTTKFQIKHKAQGVTTCTHTYLVLL